MLILPILSNIFNPSSNLPYAIKYRGLSSKNIKEPNAHKKAGKILQITIAFQFPLVKSFKNIKAKIMKKNLPKASMSYNRTYPLPLNLSGVISAI